MTTKNFGVFIKFPPLLWGDDAIAVHIESETQKNTANIYIAEITEID